MYKILCDGYPLLDLRDDDLIVSSPKARLESNTVGECSFTIHRNHPYFDKLKKLKSVFEVSDEYGVIFRGRMTNHSQDFDNSRFVDLEGAMAYFNDSVVRPYAFPDDWTQDEGYIAAAEGGNVVEFFLCWLIEQHNGQVEEFQRFKLGRVTVQDNSGNNYISRSDSKYPSTWATLKSKLFNSALGGYLCIRYEADGNYIDYLRDFELTNTQSITFGENLLDLNSETDATETYSAVVPIGASIEQETEDGGTINTTVTISSLPDGDITEDIVKEGDMIYSRSAREEYGLIIAPVDVTTWDDVTEPNNLQSRAVNWLASDGVMVSDTVEVQAVDLHFTDSEIQSFRINRFVRVYSTPHGRSGIFPLTRLEIDLLAPQNTRITVGQTKRTLTDIDHDRENDTMERIESAEKDIANNREQVTETKEQLLTQYTQVINDCHSIVLKALESYVETSNFEEFKSVLESEFSVWANGISGRVSKTESRIEDIDGDLQEKFNTIIKWFTFDIDGLTIGQEDSPFKVVIDNDRYSMFINNVEALYLDPDGRSVIPSLTVTKKLELLGIQATEDDTHINFDYIGGVE